MGRLIDADKLMEEINNIHGDILRTRLVDVIEKLVDDGSCKSVMSWMPVDRPPNILDEHGNSEDVLVKLKWYDGDITYCVGWYSERYGWSEDSKYVETIAWMPLPWMKLSELYREDEE